MGKNSKLKRTGLYLSNEYLKREVCRKVALKILCDLCKNIKCKIGKNSNEKVKS